MRRFNAALVIIAIALFTAWLDPYKDAVSKGNRMMQQKKYDAALKAYDEAKKYAPNREEKIKLSYNRANALYMLKEYSDAIAEYSKALQSKDSNVQKKAFFNMGNAYLKNNDIKKAVQAYMNALKIDPSYKPAKKNLEYLQNYKKNQKNNKDKKKKKGKGKGKKGDKDKNKKDQNKNKDKNNQNNSKNQKQKKPVKLSKEQLKNLLERMKKKPVRRQQGGERRAVDKNW